MRTFAKYLESLKIYNPDGMLPKDKGKVIPYDPNVGHPVRITSPGEYEGQEGRAIGKEGHLTKILMPDGKILNLVIGHEFEYI